jgi:hypothetical protein
LHTAFNGGVKTPPPAQVIYYKRRLPMEDKQENPVALSVVVLREEFDNWAVL